MSTFLNILIILGIIFKIYSNFKKEQGEKPYTPIPNDPDEDPEGYDPFPSRSQQNAAPSRPEQYEQPQQRQFEQPRYEQPQYEQPRYEQTRQPQYQPQPQPSPVQVSVEYEQPKQFDEGSVNADADIIAQINRRLQQDLELAAKYMKKYEAQQATSPTQQSSTVKQNAEPQADSDAYASVDDDNLTMTKEDFRRAVIFESILRRPQY